MGKFRKVLASMTGAALGLSAITMSILEVPQANAAEGEFTHTTVVKYGDASITNYRIPAVIKLKNGDLLVSYDARPANGDAPAPNSIMQKRSTDGGKTWGE